MSKRLNQYELVYKLIKELDAKENNAGDLKIKLNWGIKNIDFIALSKVVIDDDFKAGFKEFVKNKENK